MRHYLNKALKPKIDNSGNECFPVYYMFTVNRQTFKIKSRILNRPYSDAQFENLVASNNIFLQKDQEIIHTSIDFCVEGGLLNINLYKEFYAKSCTSIYYWLQEFIGNTPNRHMDEFMYGPSTESQKEQAISSLERVHNIDRFSVLSYLKGYHEFQSTNNSLAKHLLMHDWHLELRNDFTRFYNSRTGAIPPQHTNLVLFIDDLITII